MGSGKPSIVPLPNGPYYLLNDSEPVIVDNLVDYRGRPMATVRGVALCRCGQSKNKPFCDGTHGTTGFSSANTETGVPADMRKNYVAKSITVHDNRKICAHAANCIRGVPSVFRLGERPWINPDGASVQDVIETVRRCPSGALSYSIDGVEYRDREGKPEVRVSKNGPYHVTGGIELAGASWAKGASKEHYTLCRCGASKNKPFCDGTHIAIGFKDGQD